MTDLFWGAIGGGIAAGFVWMLANRAIDRQLQQGAARMRPQIQAAVREQVPPAVRAELTATLARYNITPETGRQLNAALTLADTAGLI